MDEEKMEPMATSDINTEECFLLKCLLEEFIADVEEAPEDFEDITEDYMDFARALCEKLRAIVGDDEEPPQYLH